MPQLGTLLETRVLVLPKLGALQTLMGAVVPELETVSKIHDAVMPAAGAFLESATRRAKAMKTAIAASPPFEALLSWALPELIVSDPIGGNLPLVVRLSACVTYPDTGCVLEPRTSKAVQTFRPRW